MLFVRMGIMLVVALYTSRIVLQQLGIADFGIYNVVAGIVMLMGFFNGSLAQGVQRFLNYYLAQGDFKALKSSIFSFCCDCRSISCYCFYFR